MSVTPASTQVGSHLTTGEIASMVGGRLVGPAEVAIHGLQTCEDAGPGQLTFVGSPRHARLWTASQASAAVVTEGLLAEPTDPSGRPLILVVDADQAMITLLERFAPAPESPEPGVHPMACVHATASLGREVRIAAHAFIGPRCRIGDGVQLHAGAAVHADAMVGDGSILHSGSVVRERCTLGRRVVLHANAVIGADGFGFRPDPGGRGLRKVPQIGIVEIHDDVEIGACTCIDRAKFGATVIGAGTKIDNLVQIGHNCRIGRSCVLAGCVGLAGSVTVGDGVQMGGGVGVADHLTIGTGARIAAMSAVRTDVADGATMLGVPAEPATVALRQLVALRKLPDLLRRLGADGGDRGAAARRS